jgi:hypothetical protein
MLEKKYYIAGKIRGFYVESVQGEYVVERNVLTVECQV